MSVHLAAPGVEAEFLCQVLVHLLQRCLAIEMVQEPEHAEDSVFNQDVLLSAVNILQESDSLGCGGMRQRHPPEPL